MVLSMSTMHSHLFLSTPSARRATHRIQVQLRQLPISIHALREEGDTAAIWHRRPPSNFYPRPPRGGRPTAGSCPARWSDFYPRPPRGGRPKISPNRTSPRKFLSTPSARRATSPTTAHTSPGRYFYPRPPRGGRRRSSFRSRPAAYFYPRPPRGGRLTAEDALGELAEFLSTPSARRATPRSARAVMLRL